jgi:hypothetical protein
MLRLAMVAAAATVFLGASGVVAATTTTDKDTSRDTYTARIDSKGVDGTVTVGLDAARTGGTIAWTLHGLDNGNVTIRMHGGTCEDPTNLVGSAWTHDGKFPDGTGSRSLALPTVSATAFAADMAAHRGVTAAIRNNERVIACVPFTDKV